MNAPIDTNYPLGLPVIKPRAVIRSMKYGSFHAGR